MRTVRFLVRSVLVPATTLAVLVTGAMTPASGAASASVRPVGKCTAWEPLGQTYVFMRTCVTAYERGTSKARFGVITYTQNISGLDMTMKVWVAVTHQPSGHTAKSESKTFTLPGNEVNWSFGCMSEPSARYQSGSLHGAGTVKVTRSDGVVSTRTQRPVLPKY